MRRVCANCSNEPKMYLGAAEPSLVHLGKPDRPMRPWTQCCSLWLDAGSWGPTASTCGLLCVWGTAWGLQGVFRLMCRPLPNIRHLTMRRVCAEYAQSMRQAWRQARTSGSKGSAWLRSWKSSAHRNNGRKLTLYMKVNKEQQNKSEKLLFVDRY